MFLGQSRRASPYQGVLLLTLWPIFASPVARAQALHSTALPDAPSVVVESSQVAQVQLTPDVGRTSSTTAPPEASQTDAQDPPDPPNPTIEPGGSPAPSESDNLWRRTFHATGVWRYGTDLSKQYILTAVDSSRLPNGHTLRLDSFFLQQYLQHHKLVIRGGRLRRTTPMPTPSTEPRSSTLLWAMPTATPTQPPILRSTRQACPFEVKFEYAAKQSEQRLRDVAKDFSAVVRISTIKT